jgi:hypothetical protein
MNISSVCVLQLCSTYTHTVLRRAASHALHNSTCMKSITNVCVVQPQLLMYTQPYNVQHRTHYTAHVYAVYCMAVYTTVYTLMLRLSSVESLSVQYH